MAAPMATRKVKKVAKNKKKNWRKHVHIDEVEEYLEDKRLQERTGGLVAEKTDADLFFIEKTSKPKNLKSCEQISEPVKRKRPTKDKPLKCFAKLQASSSIKIPKIARSDLPRSLRKSKRSTDKKIEKLVIAHKKKQAEKIRQRSAATKLSGVTNVYDLWSEDAEEKIFKNKNSMKGKITKNVDEHFLRQTNLMDVKVPNTGTIHKKPSAVPSVEVPHPGASYNPCYDDHQELLQQAMVIEMHKDKKEKKITRALDDIFPDKSVAPTEASRLQEMSVGIFSPIEDGDEDDEDEQEMSSGLSYNPPVRREDKKTITQRNKEKRQKEKQDQLKTKKENKSKGNELYKIKQMRKEANLQLKKEEVRQLKKSEKKKQAVFETKNLGKTKFEAPDIEVKLGEELEGSLRQLRPEGNLLADRFKSLQKRNLIETRERAKNKRKYKPKEFEKKSHREVTL